PTSEMPRNLAIITGASAGIGEVFARRLAADHDLLLVARRRDRLEKLAAELAANSGARVDVLSADLADEAGMETVAARIAAEPLLALLVNNAGFGSRGLFWESELGDAERMHRLHVMATLKLSHAALRNMVPRDAGAIVNVASVAAFVRRAGSSSYSATKSWMAVFSEGLHLELRSVGSRVSVQALCPGFTYSEFHDILQVDRKSMAPASFWLTADEVVEASLEGLRKRRLFVVPGPQYKILTALFTKLPVGLRLAVEAGRGNPTPARGAPRGGR
ncbi:MAG TPA: SDR family NAD(P)-dependent oxidoreductase, partial [Opitutaceae bacterium]|nr:SDR family NAD(P)-dependent oxidoreductase [Opitutaceae bacterium]